MSLVANERTKLLATALNNTGVATIVTGLVAPTISSFVNGALPMHGLWLLGAVCFSTGGGLPLAGQAVRARLKS